MVVPGRPGYAEQQAVNLVIAGAAGKQRERHGRLKPLPLGAKIGKRVDEIEAAELVFEVTLHGQTVVVQSETLADHRSQPSVLRAQRGEGGGRVVDPLQSPPK